MPRRLSNDRIPPPRAANVLRSILVVLWVLWLPACRSEPAHPQPLAPLSAARSPPPTPPLPLTGIAIPQTPAPPATMVAKKGPFPPSVVSTMWTGKLGWTSVDPSWEPRDCTADGWCPSFAFRWPGLRRVLALAQDDVWAAGMEGVLHFDGHSWRTVPIPQEARERSVSDLWASGLDDVWVASFDALFHWNGSDWTRCDLDSRTGHNRFHLWGFAKNNVWLTDETQEGTTLSHWNGQRWSAVPVPEQGSPERQILWATSASDIWGTMREGSGSRLGHWDGTKWSDTPGQPELHDPYVGLRLPCMWGSAPNDLWLATEHGRIDHWNGATWTRSPNDTSANISVRGQSARNVWAATLWEPSGPSPADAAQGAVRVLLQWDGSAWTRQELPTFDLQDLSIAGDGSAWALTTSGEILRRDGRRWSMSLGTNGLFLQPRAIHGLSENDVWLVGQRAGGMGSNAPPQSAVAHWDSLRFSVAVLDGVVLDSVREFAPDDVWFAGQGAAWSGVLAHWDGSKLSVSHVADPLHSIWGTGARDLWAVGEGGTILRGDGKSWRRVALPNEALEGSTRSPPVVSLFGVIGFAPQDVWIVGGVDFQPRILHWGNGGLIVIDNPGSGEHLDDIWGLAPDDLWTWKRETDPYRTGRTMHWDGHQWSPIVTNPAQSLTQIWGTSADDLWGVSNAKGGGSNFAHWDGTSWQTVDPGVQSGVNSIWGADEHEIWVTGQFGELARLTRPLHQMQ